MSVFGFSTAMSSGNGGGDFTPVLKYDARAGRFFRVDRVDTGNGFVSEPVDVTQGIKFLADFENLEVGWINFPPGGAPDFVLVRMGDGSKPPVIPGRPSESHKNGLRFMLKLSKDLGGDKPIREIAGNSKAFLSAVEAVYTQYLAEKGNHPGLLPVLTAPKIVPVKSGSGERSSTNFHPQFLIVDWKPRGDLTYVSRVILSEKVSTAGYTNGGAAPSTGDRAVPPPSFAQTRNATPIENDDFG